MTYYLIGTDEAGYGPNLGPLVVSASVWRFSPPSLGLAPRTEPRTLFDLLPPEPEEESPDADPLAGEIISRFNEVCAEYCAKNGLFPILDSKKLYVSGHIAPLECSLLIAARLLLDDRTPTFRRLLDLFAGEKKASAAWESPLPPWEVNADFSLPISEKNSDTERLTETARKVAQALKRVGVELLELRSRRVQPEEFNRILATGRNKSDLLAEVTLRLASESVRRVMKRFPRSEVGTRNDSGAADIPHRVILLCDKLGGRNDYAESLGAFFPNRTVRTLCQSRSLSGYRLDAPNESPLIVRFQAKGEANLPTALASIASKYLRELSMIPFNNFWREKIPTLRPTAGYPSDAQRFRAEIASLLSRLKIPNNVLWREK